MLQAGKADGADDKVVALQAIMHGKLVSLAGRSEY